MSLQKIILQNFRSYKKTEFTFEETTLVVGPNTSGKSNLVEAIYLLSTGKSFRTDKDTQMLKFTEEVGRVKGAVNDDELEVLITNGEVNGGSQYKKFLVNGVSKRRVDFAGRLLAVLFSPQDLEIIIESPSLRRNFLDEVLEQTDRNYRVATTSYAKALRQRNALLEMVQETGRRNEKQFEYWDNLVIENGNIITAKREELINFLNSSAKDIFDCVVEYDKSLISKERLLQYEREEVAAGVTLVGPHRDDFAVLMFNPSAGSGQAQAAHDVKFYGSRGQQRLAILQLKMLQLLFIEQSLGERPLLLLDDIFSELDEGHIQLILQEIGKQQTIITTTHEEFIPKKLLKSMKVINLQR
ncbi:MAG TPA: DNA replication and repair protein RecF [Patescibacteria group bacterium]|jgi:DNA replication and repair protein RecF|nr:DNA replication and repair protein RecF [Patescibacteria group bacterium]